MPIVGGTRANYCTVSDLIAFGVSSAQASDYSCDLASRVVEGFCGRGFGGQSSQTVDLYDLRGDQIPFPAEMSTVTAVSVNGVALDASSYDVDYGASVIRLRYWAHDVDGFPTYGYGGTPLHRRVRMHAQITGSMGYQTIPIPVVEATKRLAARYATASVSDQLPPPGVQRLMTEGYQIQIDKSELGAYETTGDPECDRLLAPYRDVRGMVG